MAKYKGFLKILGTLDGINFYKTKHGYLVRMKGGPSGKRIATDPAFKRTRENMNQFGRASGAGALLRHTFRPFTAPLKDGSLPARVVSLMMKIKNCDQFAARGDRQVATGIATAEGKETLTGLNLNLHSDLDTILRKSYFVDVLQGRLQIPDLKPGTDLQFPPGATHVTLKGALGKIGFADKAYALYLTNFVNIAINGSPSDVDLRFPDSTIVDNRTNVFVLGIDFFQEVNGQQYALQNGDYNAAKIVQVW